MTWPRQVSPAQRPDGRSTFPPRTGRGCQRVRGVQVKRQAGGGVDLGSRTVDLAGLSAPVLVVAGANDQIAPVESVRAVLPLLTGAAEARFEIVPGGHLGLLTGRTARDALWASLDEWLDEWSA